MKRIIFLLVCLATILGVQAQQRKTPFNGILMDFNENPIKKARVYISSPRKYVTTTKRGEFGLTDVNPNDTLKISIKNQIFHVPVAHCKSLSIILNTESGEVLASESQELIEKGFDHVTRRESHLGTIISGRTLTRSGYSTLMAALQGRVPGLNITGTEAPGSEGSVNIRGFKSFTGSNTPLFVVDGMIVETLTDVPLYDIDYVEILKEASFYGSRGANGAIVVFTRLP
jgi:hypothetical protein